MWELGKVNREIKGGEELRYGARSVPQVSHRQGGWVGWAGEKVSRGVRGTTARGAEVIRGSPDPLQITIEDRAKSGAQLGQSGAETTGE